MTAVNSLQEQQRKAAIKGLINIAILEGVILIAVVIAYLYSGKVAHLIGGFLGSTLLTAPMFLRWSRAHGEAMKARPNSGGSDDV
jgi:hypothetical protein